MNRTKKFFYNSLTTALYQVFLMLAGFITPQVMLRFYGSEINGLVSSINQFIAYFNLVEAGISGAAIYALYKPLANNDHQAINGVVTAAKKFYTQAGYIFISLTLGMAVIYPMFVKAHTVSTLDIGLLVLILGVNGALEFFTLSKYRVLLSADQRTYVISLASLAYIVANTAIIVIFAKLGTGIVVLRLIALFSIFLRSFILMIYAKVKYRYLNYREKPNTKALNKRWDAFYLQILAAIQNGAPVVIITLILNNLKLVSVYTVFNMVLGGIGGLLSIFISGLAASFGDVIARNEQATLQKVYREFELSYYSIITIIYAVTFVSIMPFIRIYTAGITDVSYDLPLIGFLFVLNGILYNLKTPQGMLVTAAGLFKETKMQTTIQGIIVVVGGIALAPFLGIAGVLVSSILSNIYRDVDLLFFTPRYITKLPVGKTVSRWFRMLICLMLIGVPFKFIPVNPDNYLSWMFSVTGIGIYALLVVILDGFIFDRADMKGVLRRIISVAGVGR